MNGSSHGEPKTWFSLDVDPNYITQTKLKIVSNFRCCVVLEYWRSSPIAHNILYGMLYAHITGSTKCTPKVKFPNKILNKVNHMVRTQY